MRLMRDLQNPSLIVIKAGLFLLLALLASGILAVTELTSRGVLLLVIAIWASCRFYYFAFHAFQHYVDPSYRFSGLLSLISHLRKHHKDRKGNCPARSRSVSPSDPRGNISPCGTLGLRGR